MNPNENLLARIEALEKWKVDREKQQITFPLDLQSIETLNNYFMRLTGSYSFEGGAAGRTFYVYTGQQKNVPGTAISPALFEVTPVTTYRYSITDLVNNIATIVGTTIGDGARFNISTNGVVPTPLNIIDTYWAIGVTSTTFKFSTDGVTPIDITDAGTGIQNLTFF